MVRIVLTLIVIVLLGCGVQMKTETIEIPIKISVDIPNSLTTNTETTQKISKQEKTSSKILDLNDYNNESVGHRVLTEKTYLIESIIKDIKFNIVLENSVINEVNTLCKDVLLNKVCTLTENSVQLKVTEALVTEYEKYYPKGFRINEKSIGREIPFGVIEFVKYDNNHSYHYSLNTDLTEISNQLYTKEYVLDPDYSSVIQNVQWSEDNNTILSTLDTKYVGEQTNLPWTLYYKNKPTLDEKMHLFNTSAPLPPERGDIFNFDLIKKYDVNNTNIFKLNDIQITYEFGERYIEQLSSYGRVNDNIGINRYSHNGILEDYGSTKSRADEIFDENGTTTASTYCSDSEYDECSLYDPSSWYIDTNDTAQFEAFDGLDFYELKITEGNLKDGEYFLLPANFNETNPTIESIITHNIGSFVVLEEKRQGALYDSTVLDKLDTLKLFYATYNQQLSTPLTQRDGTQFREITGEDLPIFGLFP
ncbi:MAG: Unknown protein [uncultured Sulfurovum sp.]|uniref:Lipoprotein n=1 Tax=uncultured Sulfurovum sp. TaxID=269237 RepID=A0A6S6SHB7_9BACT|nr:MAG: Unknown protein [uncultured Sulfurovum sp.]